MLPNYGHILRARVKKHSFSRFFSNTGRLTVHFEQNEYSSDARALILCQTVLKYFQSYVQKNELLPPISVNGTVTLYYKEAPQLVVPVVRYLRALGALHMCTGNGFRRRERHVFSIEYFMAMRINAPHSVLYCTFGSTEQKVLRLVFVCLLDSISDYN